ncbi:hypothetical protein [Priestia endophytica]|uniref:hypothetical protein n=1 Tax=Priestia endophytica TaxID=135735 RepID=UPI00227DB570|nr:hypothetical protein [Priestia endophytica]MCY8234888.1 hypothetical protein [Priestia endophytica]
MLFIEKANEFKESARINEFGPMEELLKFRDSFENEGLWLTDTTIKTTENLLNQTSIELNHAVNIHTGIFDDIDKIVIKHCEGILDEISKVKDSLRRDMGTIRMGKYMSEWYESSTEKNVSALSLASASRDEEE